LAKIATSFFGASLHVTYVLCALWKTLCDAPPHTPMKTRQPPDVGAGIAAPPPEQLHAHASRRQSPVRPPRKTDNTSGVPRRAPKAGTSAKSTSARDTAQGYTLAPRATWPESPCRHCRCEELLGVPACTHIPSSHGTTGVPGANALCATRRRLASSTNTGTCCP